MKEPGFSIQGIKELMESFSKNRMGGLRIQQGDFLLELEGEKVERVVAAVQAESAAAPVQQTAAQESIPTHSGKEVTSPIVGTFYAAPSPDKEPYVHVGSRVKKGDVLFIIESMKLMNEVTSEFDGVVSEIVAINEQPVEYGQPIMYIE